MEASGKRKAPEESEAVSSSRQHRRVDNGPSHTFISLLAEANCTLEGFNEALLGSGDDKYLQQQLEQRLKMDSDLIASFVAGLREYIVDENNLRRVVKPMSRVVRGRPCTCESLARSLLNVSPIQTQAAIIFLEKLPEHIDDDENFRDNIPRLILCQFRWLDYLVDSKAIAEKLLEVLSISPIGLKKDIIGFLPELVADADHEMVVLSLEQLLQEDLGLIVPVLDAFSNLNLEEHLFDQVVGIALSSLGSADAEDLPIVVRFLLQSTNALNVKEIIHQFREDLHFVSFTNVRAVKPDRKMKGKSVDTNYEALVLEAIRSGLRFKNTISEVIMKEIRAVDGEQHHKIMDVWLLLIIHANGGMHQKTVEMIFKQKVNARNIGTSLLRHCIVGHGVSLQDYFQSLLCLSGLMLRSKDLVPRQFGLHAYVLLFEEFSDAYHRQEVLGSLITHTGAGVTFETEAALDALIVLAKNHPSELLPMSSFINGILDYLEGFQLEHLYQVYEIFSLLAMASWSLKGASSTSSMADELLIFVRKQISNPDAKYKRMGIIGVVNLVTCLGKLLNFESVNADPQRATITEAVSLLEMALEMCKASYIARGFFYDELAGHTETLSFHISIIEWISKHTNEFETTFLGDLEDGRIRNGSGENRMLAGELWHNLDGDISPIYVKFLTLLVSPEKSASNSLFYLPSNFRLLSAVERVTNQGSLGSIDALLGCPIYLPKSELLVGESWKKLSKRQKEVSCHALFYASNWLRELINAFSTQLESRNLSLTQASKEEIIAKLLKRLRNLLLLEYLFTECIKYVPYANLPQLHFFNNGLKTSLDNACSHSIQKGPTPESKQAKKCGRRKAEVGSQHTDGKPSQISQVNAKLRQPTILDAFGKTNKDSSQSTLPKSTLPSQNGINHVNGCSQAETGDATGNEACINLPSTEKWKFRPLSVSSLFLLSVSQSQKKTCCLDPSAEIPLHLYLLQDLLFKLETLEEKHPRKGTPWGAPSGTPKPPSGLGKLGGFDVLLKLQTLFPSLRAHLDNAVMLLKETHLDICDDHWASEAENAGNPGNFKFSPLSSETVESVFAIILRCLGKIMKYAELWKEKSLPLLKDLLLAFSLPGNQDDGFTDLLPRPAMGSLSYMLCSVYAYLDSLFNAAINASITVAIELVIALKLLVECAESFLDTNGENRRRRSSFTNGSGVSSYLRRCLSVSAGKVLEHDWDAEENGKAWKNKGDSLQELLQLLIRNNESPVQLLEGIACNIMPQVPLKAGKSLQNTSVPYPALCPATFLIWYRVQHEIVLDLFNRKVKDILLKIKSKTGLNGEAVEELILSSHQHVVIHASLVNLTRTHDKIPVHAIAVKFGGKFVDIFLKIFDFLQAHYEAHTSTINSLVKELQKATRTIQTICSEAKGQKKMPVTCRVPAVKRSMERYVFCVKALLHGVDQGTTFWMGNLKHKDLQGREIGSQLVESDEENHDADNNGIDTEGIGA